MEKKIITFLIILFVLSSAYLFYVDNREIDPDYQKNWWAIHFQDIKSENLGFAIENHSDSKIFSWKILIGKEEVGNGIIEIGKGSSREINVDFLAPRVGRTTISVKNENGEQKDIYKNFSE